jgi:PAS domain S-box-containing protein
MGRPHVRATDESGHAERYVGHEVVDLYRLLVDGVQDYAIYALDATGRIATWNTGAERLKGYAASEVIGRHFSIFYSLDDLAAGKPQRELEIAARAGRFEDEGWRIRKDGLRFWANVVVTAIYDPDGELIAFAKITRDLTERRAAEDRAIANTRRLAIEESARTHAEERARDLAGLLEQLREKTAELERRSAEAEAANRAKGDFLAAMSHELRTPLNAIAGYTELLAMGIRGPISEPQRLDLERIRLSQEHLLGIINDILNFSRIEAGKVTYDFGRVSLCDVVESVSAMISPQALAKGVHYSFAACPVDAAAFADRAKVEQILLNLLSNAVKFTESGGRVRMECSMTDDTVAIDVQDTGSGIAQDKLDSVFEPFVQLNRTLTNMQQGTGLGLAISRDLARAMGGELRAESKVGRGSTFTLTLPRMKKRTENRE